MTIQRRSLYGFPPPTGMPSTHTVRSVPLTYGVTTDQPWPARAPGSADSMSNFVPLDGGLVPRSRLSSLNTIRTLSGNMTAMAVINYANPLNSPRVWIATSAQSFGVLCSGGSISLASFTSAFGQGLSFLAGGFWWNFAQVYSNNLGDNMLVAAGPDAAGGSNTSLLVLYQATPNGSKPQYSFLTSAPRAAAVGEFDNYLIAFNVNGFMNRVQWCARGEPSNWTGEGSGFEDLLEMRGIGAAVVPTPDGRVYLMSNEEIWYGVRAAYPAQFSFFPLEPDVGVRDAATIQTCDKGILFLGNDKALRLLPYGGGKSVVIAPSLAAMLRNVILADYTAGFINGVFDYATNIYYLAYSHSGTPRGVLVNIETGEWGFQTIPNVLSHGAGLTVRSGEYTNTSRIVLFTSASASATTVYSLSSTLGTDSGSTVTAIWQPAPLATDLPGSYKQLTEVALDYRATSPSTVMLRLSVDGGNNFEATGQAVSLASAPYAARAVAQVYNGGAFPALELTSTSTGFSLHRIDVSMNLGGRR